MTLICPKCRSKNIDYMGVLGTEEPRYECRDCGYVGPLVVEDGIAQGNAYSAGDAHLICPNCGSESLEKAAPDARGVSMPGYICRKCGYSGASALKKEAVKTHGGFPYIEILILFFLSMAYVRSGVWASICCGVLSRPVGRGCPFQVSPLWMAFLSCRRRPEEP